jgi:hypothetical protein
MKLDAGLIEYLKRFFVARKGDTTIGGSLLPDETDVYSLGSSARRYQTLYVRTLIADSVSSGSGATDADTVDGFHAYASPQPNSLLALDVSSKFPTSVYPDALLRDGSRSLTGNLTVAEGVTVDGVDISAHAGNGTIHHLTGMGADDHSQYMHNTIGRTVSAIHQFSPASPTAPFTLTGNAQGQTVTGLRADQLNKSIGVSGLGLSGGGLLTADRTITLTSSSYPGAAASVLASNSGGGLQLTNLILERTTEQLRLGYNTSNYARFTVESDGSLLVDTVSGGAGGN